MIRIEIPGKPIAKKRPRFARRGKFVVTYSDQETEAGKWLLSARQQYTGQPLTGPLYISTIFYMPRPKGHFGSGKNAGIKKTSAPDYHISKPDIDNLLKFVYDCLNGLAWADDAQLVRVTAAKLYSNDTPKTIIDIRQETE